MGEEIAGRQRVAGRRGRPWRGLLVREKAVRMGADAAMVSVALLGSFVVRFLLLFTQIAEGRVGRAGSPSAIFWVDLRSYFVGVAALWVICLGVFYASGFYTEGRAYRSRYKTLVVLQAVTLAYALFGAVVFLVRDLFSVPRAVLLLAWPFTAALLIGSRVWSSLWTRIARVEGRGYERLPAERTVRHVLVIGGAGYIGSALLRQLLQRGYRVRLLDLFVFGDQPIADLLGHPNLEVVRADFRQVHRVVEAMQGMDAAVHLGAIVGDPACAIDEELTIEVNLMATKMIAAVAKGSGVQRFVFASTCSVYGASPEILDEGSPLRPLSLYARSKVACERVLLQMMDHDLAPVILRFSTIYGLSGRTRFDLVANLLTARAITERKMTVIGGQQWRPFVHVEDAAGAVLKVIEAPLYRVKGQILNVGSDDQNHTIEQVAEIIRGKLPAAQLVRETNAGDLRDYHISFKKIRRTLGFKPRWTVEKGIEQVIDAMLRGKVEDYEDPRHSNVRFLSEEKHALVGPSEPLVRELLRGGMQLKPTATRSVASRTPGRFLRLAGGARGGSVSH